LVFATSRIAGKLASTVDLSLTRSPVASTSKTSATVKGVHVAFAEACALQLV
jgi:hypothetical protein